MTNQCARLNPWKFGLGFGLIWGLGVLLTGWAAWLWAYGILFVRVLGSVYLGYEATFVGGIIGGIWGFIDFFIFAALVALVYNCSCGSKEKTEKPPSKRK